MHKTHTRGAGHIEVFFQHACKGQLANLSTSDKRILSQDYEKFGPVSAHEHFCLDPLKLPKLDFSDLCKSAMVCKAWNAAVKDALVLLDTLYFSSTPAK